MAQPRSTRLLTALSALRGEDVVVALFIPRKAENFLPTLRTVQQMTKFPVVVGSPQPGLPASLTGLEVAALETWSAATLVNDVWLATEAHVLALTDAVLLPSDPLTAALAALEGDLRIATVSFFCNASSFLSFPHQNHPVERTIEGHDETSLTRRLRQVGPGVGAVPIAMATGPAVLLSSTALGAVGLLENAGSGRFAPAVADFSFRCRARGFFDVLDPETYVARPSDISVEPGLDLLSTGLTPDENGWLHERHPVAHRLVDQQSSDPSSPLSTALTLARVKARGVRVLVDGTCLGLQEMGTQATTVATISALAASPEVASVGVLLPGPVPPYAEGCVAHPKVRTARVQDGGLVALGRHDVAHRPFQPNESFDVKTWRDAADRVVVTVHDLISYHIGPYSGKADVWMAYRALLRDCLPSVDAVVVISEDVARMLEFERLGVATDRVHVVPNGTEHLTGGEPAAMPPLLAEAGLAAAELLVCLGTNYSHKNRDLAVLAHAELRRRGHRLHLVMAGPAVPWGSSRALEAAAGGTDDVIVLPDVPSLERNWLLRHAAAVLYPTSAEGFGLIPFEAARFGTPTVHVGFGPLEETLGALPVLAKDWSPTALADATEALLTDPALAAAQVAACLQAGQGFTWDTTAERLNAVYRSVLARPTAR